MIVDIYHTTFVRQSRTLHGHAKLLAEKENRRNYVLSRQKGHEDISGCTDTQSVYGPKVSGATTLLSPDGSTRPTVKDATCIYEC